MNIIIDRYGKYLDKCLNITKVLKHFCLDAGQLTVRLNYMPLPYRESAAFMKVHSVVSVKCGAQSMRHKG